MPVFPTLSPAQATLAALPKPPQPTPAHPIGGGTVESGPFTFTLLLYHDETLSPTTNLGPWAYSDLPGVGWYADWIYHGPAVEQITEIWGTEPHESPRLGPYMVRDGDHGGRAGGGVLLPGGALPGEVREGDTVRLVYKVQTPRGTYGAALVFVLRRGVNGWEPTDIRVEALPSATPLTGSTTSPTSTTAEAVSTVVITGTVGSVMLSARVIELQSPVQGFTHIALTQETKMVSAEGLEINDLRDLLVGTKIQVLGQPGASGALIAEEVRVLP